MITRRAALTTLGAAIAAPSVLRASVAGARRFTVLRDGDDIGFQTNKVVQQGDSTIHTCQIRLKIKVLGITAYRYEMDFEEEWRGGELVSLNSTCNDDGDDAYARVKREGDGLMIDGSGYQGPCPLGVATTSYWSFDFMRRKTWISTQSGDMLPMSATNVGPAKIAGPSGPVTADRWDVKGGYDVSVFYLDGEWLSISFDAGGETATYVPDTTAPQFMAAWNG